MALISKIVSCINEFEALVIFVFDVSFIFVDQVITRGEGFYRVEMYTSFLKELRLSLAFHDISKDSLLGRLVPNVLPSDKQSRYM
jgi:hypothetical protein